MKIYINKALRVIAMMTLVSACDKAVLDRPQLTQPVDNNYWRGETDVRLFANGFYAQYFVGYNSAFTVDYTPARGYNFNDDVTSRGVQAHFESVVPASRASTAEGAAWLQQYAGPNWNFSWVRKSNIFINRLTNVAQPNLTPEAYNHWLAVARFFRGFEYSRLVRVFGAVPYFGDEVADNDVELMYKDRDDRGVVMDNVYDDFRFVLDNIRTNDGKQFLNKYIAAGFITRLMLFEGTFQHYHGLDAARAKKYLELAVEAAEVVMSSGLFTFTSDFKSLFASESLDGNKEIIMWRSYTSALNITHHIGSYSNGTETLGADANLVMVKSFICNDGRVWQQSTVPGADNFSVPSLARTRDPRFEATFIDRAHTVSTSLFYQYKFASREAITYFGGSYPAIWASNTNTNDAPVMRLAEVVLNWIEARAVLAQYFGGAAITQNDLDRSVNAVRNRPLDAAAIAKGVQKTAPMLLSALPSDPARDADVPPLIWEIRRERRMEFAFEYARLLDLKRWKKIRYMDFSTNPDYFLGAWVNAPVEIPSYFVGNTYVNRLKVKKADGTIVTYNGNNAADMIGFFVIENASNRNAFGDEVYLAPVGQTQIAEYTEVGKTLSQTVNW